MANSCRNRTIFQYSHFCSVGSRLSLVPTKADYVVISVGTMLFWPILCKIIPRVFQFVFANEKQNNKNKENKNKNKWEHSPLFWNLTRQYDAMLLGNYFDEKPQANCRLLSLGISFLIKMEKENLSDKKKMEKKWWKRKSVFILFAGRISNYLPFIAKNGWEWLISRGRFMKNFLTTSQVSCFNITWHF